MMMLRKIMSGLILALSLSGLATASTFVAVDLAAQQGMLSQRLVKIHCQIALNIAPDLSRRQLEQSAGKFEENLMQLKSLASGPKAISALAELNSAWLLMQTGIRAEPDASSAGHLNQQANAVTHAAEQLAFAFEDQSAPVASRWTNTASRQRMLSQRIAKAYLLRQLGQDNARTRQELESASHEFSGAMSSMQTRIENSPATRAALAGLETQWEWLSSALAVEGARDYRLIVAAGSDLILEFANQLSVSYSTGKQ